MALDILTVPGSSADCERVFGELGDLLESRRLKMKPATISAIQCTRAWAKKGSGIQVSGSSENNSHLNGNHSMLRPRDHTTGCRERISQHEVIYCEFPDLVYCSCAHYTVWEGHRDYGRKNCNRTREVRGAVKLAPATVFKKVLLHTFMIDRDTHY